MTEPRPILLAAGGTGGHLFPAAALAAALRDRGAAVDLATDARALKYGGEFPARCDPQPFPPRRPPARARSTRRARPRCSASAFWRRWRCSPRLRPRAVVGFGGYPTVPPLLAAWLLGAPSVLHEQNAVIGRANRFLAPRVSRIATGFPEIKGLAAALAAKTRYTGNPVRPAVIAAAATPYPGFDDGRLHLLVTGGSQGARVMADVVPAALALLSAEERARVRLTMQARGEDKARVAAACAEMQFPVELAEFFADLPARIAGAHLVVGRSGASTVSELAVIGRPSILVPFPHALDQDQAANAAILAAAGAATVVPQTRVHAAAARRAAARRARRPGGARQSRRRRPGRRRRRRRRASRRRRARDRPAGVSEQAPDADAPVTPVRSGDNRRLSQPTRRTVIHQGDVTGRGNGP